MRSYILLFGTFLSGSQCMGYTHLPTSKNIKGLLEKKKILLQNVKFDK